MNAYVGNVYLDSNVFIFAACSDDQTGKDCKRILDYLVKGKMRAITSCLTFDEVFYKIKKLGGFELAIIFAENFLAMPNLSFAEVNPGILAGAIDLLKKYNKLAPKDAVHAATAQLHRAQAFVSDDKDFFKLSEIRWLDVAGFVKSIETGVGAL